MATNNAMFMDIPGVGNPDGLPQIRVPDSLVTPGTLIYLDPTLPGREWAPGLPGKVPNLADYAPDLTGSQGAAEFDLANTVTTGRVERTAKGGLHAAFKRGAGGGNESLTLSNSAIRQYLAANPSHRYYIASSFTMTQTMASSYTVAMGHRWGGVFATTQAAQITVIPSNDKTAVTVMPPTNRESVTPSPVRTGIGVVDGVVNGYSGTVGTSTSLIVHHNGGAGSGAASRVDYLWFLEDLTVSGRSADQVRSAFMARHSEVRGAGGRYNGDTFTDPTTL